MAEEKRIPKSEKQTDRRSDKRDRRDSCLDRRSGLDRREVNEAVEFDRRRGPGKRRTEDRRSAEEGEMTREQFDFVMAVDQYKQANNRPFPTLTEVLDILRAIGYRKVAEPEDIQ